jgi:hypothetical protein
MSQKVLGRLKADETSPSGADTSIGGVTDGSCGEGLFNVTRGSIGSANSIAVAILYRVLV